MRIYQRPSEAFKEVERELWEMGIEVHPETMQDKYIKNNPDYCTKELRGYSFMIANWAWEEKDVERILAYFFPGDSDSVRSYIEEEFLNRTSEIPTNPGSSYKHRLGLWEEFLHEGKFAYTYSERISPQLDTVLDELRKNPNTRQAIINIHSNICPLDYWPEHAETNVVNRSKDLDNIGGQGRVPCSIYYQILLREGKIDLIYAMRSCDFLTHFPVDVLLALKLQNWFAEKIELGVGRFTYFVGSLHAYYKDLKVRGIF